MTPTVAALPRRIVLLGKLVKFSHTVFALPFALAMLVVLSREYPIAPWQVGAIVSALVAARTAAMGFNRIVDRTIDQKNPRTTRREIPSGQVTVGQAVALVAGCTVIFLVCAALLGTHCLLMAPPVLAILFGYSLSKRFTRYSHLVLGLALACAPGGVWYALTATFSWLPVPLMGAVLFWVAGFDILYSCQDYEFDRTEGLFSMPSRIGVSAALKVARVLHVATVGLLFLFGMVMELGGMYFAGVAVFAALLVNQHLLVRADDLSRVDAVFFTRNGLASALFFLFVLADVAL